jgi:signal transduction histidine kinase
MEPHAPSYPSTAKRARRFGPTRSAIRNARGLSNNLLSFAAGGLAAAFVHFVRRTTAPFRHAPDAWLQAVVDEMPEGIAIMDANGRVVVESRCLQLLSAGEPFARDRLGNRVTIDLRRPWGDRVLPDDSPIIRAITHNQTTRATEFAVRRADGELVPVMMSAAPIRSAGGTLAGAAMIVRDISARRAFERLREEWASLIVHDLQQPISAIVLRSDLLLGSDLHAKQQDAVSHIRAMALRLSSMVNDLNDSAQLEASRMRLKPTRLDLGAVAREVVNRVPGAASRTTLRLPAGGVLFVKGDAERLEQVMTNLLSNALKYGAPDTEIVLELRECDEDAEVLVVNSGPGISADELPRLFDRYMRSRTVRREETKGLGLGLYIAKGLVQAHGGRIWAESALNRTTFHFTIPLDAA